MNEGKIIELSKQAYSKEDLVKDLQNLSLQQGDCILVHSSLSKIGWVIGREVAVVEALLEVIGEDGTIIMPCFSGENSAPELWGNPPVPASWVSKIKQHMPAFHPAITPTREMGRIVNSFWHYPGVIRSLHPQVSFCGYGKLAHAILEKHSLTPGLGNDSPLAKLYQYKAKVVLLGVGYNNCTCLHLSESNFARANTIKTGVSVVQDGKAMWIDFEEIDYDDSDFHKLGLDYEKEFAIIQGVVGQAPCKVLDLKSICDYADTWFINNR